MARHTTFRYRLDPTVEQRTMLDRHAGAARFAFNHSLRTVKTALTQRLSDGDTQVPWSGFDLIKRFNEWKKSEKAGRVFTVGSGGVAEIEVTGLAWRSEVCQQVFEEGAVDCARALTAWSESRSGKRKGTRIGFPRFKKKSVTVPSFRLRDKNSSRRRSSIRIGDGHPRSITLPGVGVIRVHDDTRPLRRLVAKERARILFATVSRRSGHWWLALNVEAAELHPATQHSPRESGDQSGWVGLDRGLSAFVVAATNSGSEVARIDDAPKALSCGMRRQRNLARSLARKQKGSKNRIAAAARLGRHHHRMRNIRQHFLHQASNELVKTHDRLVLEDLNVAGMLSNRRLARAIGDAAWAEFARLLRYKQRWHGGAILTADRWFPSSQLCSLCGARNTGLTLADRVFSCGNGHKLDHDLNAATNLACWGAAHDASSRTPDLQAGGRANNARRREGSDQHSTCAGETSPNDTGTDVHAAPVA